jgi:tRNA1(Val) A37 N6-methylase TrmN6
MPISPDRPEPDAVTVDRLLDGRVTLMQPMHGARAAIDPVLLAAAVPARAGERVLELGCGTGAAALCLAARVAGCRVDGIDIQADLVALARAGAVASGLAERVAFHLGDLVAPPPPVAGTRYHHVMANPPHLAAGAGRVSPDPARRLANVEGDADLAAWLRSALDHARAGGTVTIVHRAERAGEVAAGLAAAPAAVVIFPLWPKQAGRGARRSLIQARLGTVGGVRQASGLGSCCIVPAAAMRRRPRPCCATPERYRLPPDAAPP